MTSRLLRLAFLLLMPALAEGQRTWHPTITAVSPTIVQHGATLTITGTDLKPPGWRRRVVGPMRYSPSTSITEISVGVGNQTQITIPADRALRGDSIRVEWMVEVDSLALQNPIPAAERTRWFPTAIVVQSAPDLTWAGDRITPDLGTPFALLTASNGQSAVKGSHLRRTSLPAMTLAGAPLTVLAHQYDPRGRLDDAALCCGSGADRVVFSAPAAKISGWLVLDNSLGRDSIAVTYALPPAPSQVVQQTGTGTAPLSPAQTLYRGRSYVVRGQHLSITHTMGGATSIKRGSVQLGGTTITPTFASDTNIVFTVPTAMTTGVATLTVSTVVGSAAMGSVTVADAPVALHVIGLSQRTIVISGTEVTFTAQVEVPAGVDKSALGHLLVTAPGAPLGAIRLPRPVPVTGPTVPITFLVGALQNATPVTIQVSHESNGVNGITVQTRQTTFTVRPPHPVLLEFPVRVTSGTSSDIQVRFDSTTGRRSPIFALVSSSNPNVVAVPASVTIDGDKATIPISVPPQTQGGGTATISVSIDGVTASGTTTVQLPTVQQVALYREGTTTAITSAKPGEAVMTEVSFTGALPVSTTSVDVATSDTALRPTAAYDGSVRAPFGLSSDGRVFRRYFEVARGLSQQTTATLTASYGGATRTASLTLTPVVVSSFTATPTSGRAGSTLTLTALIAPPPAPLTGMSIEFTSTNPLRAAIGTYATSVPNGTTSKSVTVQLLGPVAVPQQVPITVTLRSGPTIVSQQTIVATVMP